METFVQDLRFALRQLLKSPGFAVVAILTLALGIGANTAIFSVVNGVLLRPLPYPQSDEIVQVLQIDGERRRGINIPDLNFEDWHEQNRSFQALAQYQSGISSVSGGSEPVRVLTATVSRDFFRVMGVQPLLGRSFTRDEQQLGGSPAVLVSHDYWMRYLDADPNLAGRTLGFNGRSHDVVGVLPPEFSFPDDAQLWVPRELFPVNPSRTAHNWRVMGRLAPEVPLEEARRDMSAISRRLKAEYGDDITMADATLVPLQEQIVGSVRPALLILIGAAGFLLLIACANVVNLLLARAAVRRRELAMRLALGAGRRRLAQQFLTESLVLALLGGVLGVLLAVWGVEVLLTFESGNLPRLEEIGVNRTVLLFALGISLAAAVALGLMAAWRATGEGAEGDLSGSQRTQVGSRASNRVRDALVVSQIGLTFVLLIGTGLLGRSFLRLVDQDPGFRTEGAVVMRLALPSPQDGDATRLANFHGELLERLRALPGVDAVAGANALPLGGSYSNGTFLVVNHPEEVQDFDDFRRVVNEPGRTGEAQFRIASEDYFRAMSIPLLRGRLFELRDGPDANHVAVVSESLAERQWPGEDPIGKLIQFGNMDGDLRAFTVVGVVGDIREFSLEAEPRPTFYGYSRQRPATTATFSFVIQGRADAGSIIPAARAIVQEMDPDLPASFSTLDEIFSASLAERRFNLTLLGVFGGTALILALMGIYGVMSFTVAHRTREIGVRMALGAHRGTVVGLVVRQGLVLAGIGIMIGLAGALALTRLMQGLLYGVTATDAVTFVAVPLLLATIALLAAFLPARRATRVDPIIALRAE